MAQGRANSPGAVVLKDGSINPNLTPTQRGKAAQQTEDAVARRFGLTDALSFTVPGSVATLTLPRWSAPDRRTTTTMPPTL